VTLKQAKLQSPLSICLENQQNILVGDHGNGTIRRLNIHEDLVTTITGKKHGFNDGNLAQSNFNHPFGIAYDKHRDFIVVGDYNNHRIRLISERHGLVLTLAGSSDRGCSDGEGSNILLS